MAARVRASWRFYKVWPLLLIDFATSPYLNFMKALDVGSLKGSASFYDYRAKPPLDQPYGLVCSMKHVFRLVVPLFACFLTAACAAGSSDAAHAASSGIIGEFVLGLWHGFISPITLIVEIINSLLPHILPWHTHLYETKAEGVAYDLGFYLGLGGGPVVIWRRWRR